MEESTLDLSKIKIFKHILELSGKSMKDVTPFQNATTKFQIQTNAFCRLVTIAEVLNEGWYPDWNNHNQYKYFPYFIQEGSTLRFASYDPWGSSAGMASGLYYKNSELAKFAGKTFINHYRDFIL